MPSSFLEVAEASGLIAGIGPLVLERVCRDISDRPEFTGHISINVSAVELAQADWGKNFNAVINRHLIDPARLIIEVTETSVMEMLPTTKTAIRALTSRGVGLHLDDFGTGFSSISILRDLPVSGVKLDRRFVQDVSAGEGPANALSRGLAGLVSGLDLAGIAEGVESSHQASVLADQGWGFGQGYYYGRPCPLPERHEVSTISGAH
jgi:EAL domain-containing protein (putative c-di-GMP-specific phosphodiesterase class I)